MKMKLSQAELVSTEKCQLGARSKSTPPSKIKLPLFDVNGNLHPRSEHQPRSKPRSKSQRAVQQRHPHGRHGDKDSRIAPHGPSERAAEKSSRRSRRKSRGRSKARTKAGYHSGPLLSLPKTNDGASRTFMVEVSDRGEVLQLVEYSPSHCGSAQSKQGTLANTRRKKPPPPPPSRGRVANSRSRNDSRGVSSSRDRPRARTAAAKSESGDDKTEALGPSDGGIISDISRDKLASSNRSSTWKESKESQERQVKEEAALYSSQRPARSSSTGNSAVKPDYGDENTEVLRLMGGGVVSSAGENEPPPSKRLTKPKEPQVQETAALYSSQKQASSSTTGNSALRPSLRSSLRSTLSVASERTALTGFKSTQGSDDTSSRRSVGFADVVSSMDQVGRVQRLSKSLNSQDPSLTYQPQSRGRLPVTESISERDLPDFMRARSHSRSHAHGPKWLTSDASSQDHGQSVASANSAPGHPAPRQARSLSRTRNVVISDHVDLDPATSDSKPRQRGNYIRECRSDSQLPVQKSLVSHGTAGTAAETFLSTLTLEASDVEDGGSVLSDQTAQAVTEEDPLMNSTVTLFEDDDDQSVLSGCHSLASMGQGPRVPRDAPSGDGARSAAEGDPEDTRWKESREDQYSKLARVGMAADGPQLSNETNQAVAAGEDPFMNSAITLFEDDDDQSVLSVAPALMDRGSRVTQDELSDYGAKKTVDEDPKETREEESKEDEHPTLKDNGMKEDSYDSVVANQATKVMTEEDPLKDSAFTSSEGEGSPKTPAGEDPKVTREKGSKQDPRSRLRSILSRGKGKRMARLILRGSSDSSIQAAGTDETAPEGAGNGLPGRQQRVLE